MPTLNQIVESLKDIGSKHAQINTVKYGDFQNFLDDKDIKYPLMFISYPTPSISGKELTYRFSFLFADLVLKEMSNVEEVISDQMEIALDVYSLLSDNKHPWQYPTAASFEQIFDDSTPEWLGGCSMNVAITIPFAYDRCQVPRAKSIFTDQFTNEFQ